MAQIPPDGSGTQDSPHLVVGLGASAGGLEALEAFFSGLPTVDSVSAVVQGRTWPRAGGPVRRRRV